MSSAQYGHFFKVGPPLLLTYQPTLQRGPGAHGANARRGSDRLMAGQTLEESAGGSSQTTLTIAEGDGIFTVPASSGD